MVQKKMYNPDQGWLFAEAAAGEAKGICWEGKWPRKPVHCCFSQGMGSSMLPLSASLPFLFALKQPQSGLMLDLKLPTEVCCGAGNHTEDRGTADLDDGQPSGR